MSSIWGSGQREYVDARRTQEVDGPSWRLTLRLERKNGKIVYVNDSVFNCSPRRLLEEPLKVLGPVYYDSLNSMRDYRTIDENAYSRLEHLADKVDFSHTRRYVLQYYLLAKCIVRPDRIKKHIQYFGDFHDQLLHDISEWRKDYPNAQGKDLFAYSEELVNTYGPKMLAKWHYQMVQ